MGINVLVKTKDRVEGGKCDSYTCDSDSKTLFDLIGIFNLHGGVWSK